MALIAVGLTVYTSIADHRSARSIQGTSSIQPVAAAETDRVNFDGRRSTWELLALPDEELEKVSLVELNLAVAREIPGHEDLDLAKYEQIVETWADEFAAQLPWMEQGFRGREVEYENDIRFFRIGQLMAWLGHEKGIEYIPEQRDANAVIYEDPGELFLHGLLDTNLGTCGNMPTLQAAIARRLGWPVSLAPVEAHTVCRYDDGEVSYNIETTQTDKGGFSADTDDFYIEKFNLPPQATAAGDTLKTMSAREMLGYFIALRGRYYRDTGQLDLADQDYSLARALLPRHRKVLLASIETTLWRGGEIFARHEQENPVVLSAQIGLEYLQQQRMARQSSSDYLRHIDRVSQMNAMNRQRMQQDMLRAQMSGRGNVPNPYLQQTPSMPGFPHHPNSHFPQ
ncbi:MAG: hypothetical protein AAGG38_06410 [Planctomycetota bacterium]